MEHDELQPMDLPPGFRFHPTDEELITHYLARKDADAAFAARAIGEADLNKCEPWDLPSRGKMGEKEWYVFCLKDRKYPTGMRTNRATVAGYWKATGKDREIFRGKAMVGMKKTLVFYTGRAPKGGKTGWVMHEYRLADGGKLHHSNLHKAASNKNEWMLCRVFKKSSAGAAKKGAEIMDDSSLLPPLMDMSGAAASAAAHVTCFSNALEGQFLNPTQADSSTDHLNLASFSPFLTNLQYGLHQDVSLVHLLESNGYGLVGGKQQHKGERERLSASQDTGVTSDMNNPEVSSSSGLKMDHEALWSY